MTRDRFLLLFLRMVGTVAGSAALCAVMPLRAMDAAHRAIGMGPLPSQPIVEYLARSTSAFYALLSALLWAISLVMMWRLRTEWHGPVGLSDGMDHLNGLSGTPRHRIPTDRIRTSASPVRRKRPSCRDCHHDLLSFTSQKRSPCLS